MTGFAISEGVGFSGRAELHLLVFPLPLSYLSSLVASSTLLVSHLCLSKSCDPRSVSPILSHDQIFMEKRK